MTETAKALAQSIVKGLVAKHNLKLTDEVRAQITNEQKESIQALVQKLEQDVKSIVEQSSGRHYI